MIERYPDYDYVVHPTLQCWFIAFHSYKWCHLFRIFIFFTQDHNYKDAKLSKDQRESTYNSYGVDILPESDCSLFTFSTQLFLTQLTRHLQIQLSSPPKKNKKKHLKGRYIISAYHRYQSILVLCQGVPLSEKPDDWHPHSHSLDLQRKWPSTFESCQFLEGWVQQWERGGSLYVSVHIHILYII